VSPLAPPPVDLSDFPVYTLTAEPPLYRVHRRGAAPWWFSRDGSGRFDLAEESRGTCYVAARRVGALIEVFRTGTLIPEVEVSSRFLATLHAPAETSLADCTVGAARGYGVTGALHTQPDYELTRAWADAFARAGFGGIRYLLSHDPSQGERGIALFGPAGAQELPVEVDGPIPRTVLDEAFRRFGLLVAPTPA
jgi:hypothetical protein